MNKKKVIYFIIFGLFFTFLIFYSSKRVFYRIDSIYLNSYNMLNNNSNNAINPKTSTEKTIYNYFYELYLNKETAKNNSYIKYKDENMNPNFYKEIDSYYEGAKSYSEDEYKILNNLKTTSTKEKFVGYLKEKGVFKIFINYLNKKIDKKEFINSNDIDNILASDEKNFNELIEYIEYLKSRNNEWSYIDGNIICKNESLAQIIKDKNNEYGIDMNVSLEFKPNTNKRIPVLMYHGVSNETWGIENLFMKTSDFDKQMKYIHDNYETIFIEDITKDYSNKKVVALTFDDGYIDFYNNVLPILKKYNLKANLYVITAFKGEKNLSDDQIKKISDSGLVSIGSHTVNHHSLPTLSDEELDKELKDSKEYLEKLLNKKVKTICYPSGKYDSRVIEYTSKYYDYALAIEGKVEVMNSSFNRYAIKRFRVYRNTSFNSFKDMLKSAN